MGLKKGFNKNLALNICKARNKEIFKNEEDLKIVFRSLHNTICNSLQKKTLKTLKMYFGITN